MRLILSVLCLATAGSLAADAQVCGPNDIVGAYGFQLSGTTTIGVKGAQPMVAIGRLVFDDKGGVGGLSSADLDGYFLGNPVTGSYTFNSDCSFTLQLQDTSGAFQHFAGKVTPYGARAEIHQTDADTGERGVLEKTATGCQTASLHGDYKFALSGTASQFATVQTPGSTVSIGGTLSADGAGNLVFVADGGKTTGSYQLDSDCVAEMEFGAILGEGAVIVKLRGVLVNGGKLLLAAESDPAAIATARLTAKP